MAEQKHDQERTENATPKRREEARRKGQVPRSRELSAAAVTLCGSVALYWNGAALAVALEKLMRTYLSLPFDPQGDGTLIVRALATAIVQALLACLPALGVMFLVALTAPMILSGWNFSGAALVPKFSRLNPAAGIKRILSLNGVIELFKSLAKFAVVAVIAVLVLRNDLPEFMALGRQNPATAIQHAVQLSGLALIVIASGLLFIAAIDVPYQLWQHNKSLRMTRQEIRDELRDSDGAPEVRQRIRRLQQEAARRRMMAAVPKADVVITNPTHFAVALRYDDKRMRAPIVVAKGADLIAARIRELATAHKVAIFEAPPLARVLYRNVDIDHEIPATLYRAVAQVLTYIYQLRAAKRGDGLMPARPSIEVAE